MADVIDLRRSLQPEKSYLAEGVKGLLGGFIKGQGEQQEKRDFSKYLQDERGYDKEKADRVSNLEKDFRKIQLARDDKQLNREQEFTGNVQTLMNSGAPLPKAIEIASISNASVRNAEMKRFMHPSLLDGILQTATGYINQLTAPTEQQQPQFGLGALEQLDPTAQQQPQQFDPLQQQVDPTQQQEPQQPAGIGQQLATGAGQIGTGALTTLAGIPGDLLSLVDKMKGEPQSTREQKDQSIKEWEAKRDASEPGSFDRRQADRIIESLKDDPDKRIEEVKKFIPTGEKIRKDVVPALTKDTFLEKFTIPHSTFEKNLQDFGGTTAILARMGANPAGTMVNLLKAGGVALAGDAAGWMTEKATGSESIGNVIKNGTYLAYAAFGGLPKKLAEEKYAEWTSKVVKPAADQNKLVDMSSAFNKLDKIGDKAAQIFGEGNPAGKLMQTEIEVAKALGIKANPEAIQNNITRMSETSSGIPDQAKGIFGEIESAVKEPLVNFSNKMIKGGGELLNDANSLFSTSKNIAKDREWIRSFVSVRNAPMGGAIWLAGGLKPLIAAGLVGGTGKFAARLLSSSAWRKASTELFRAAASRNASLVNKILPKLDKQTEKILSKSPKADQAEIRKAIKKAQDNFTPQEV